jgi:hypothetical protein
MDHQSLRPPEVHEEFLAYHFPREHVLLQTVLDHIIKKWNNLES